MPCAQFRSQHLAWLDGELPGSSAMAQRAHADDCARCAHYDTQVRHGLLVARNRPPLSVSTGFRAELFARLEE
jgi:hypothetical protein